MKRCYKIGPENPNFQTGKTVTRGYVVLTSKIWGKDHGRREHCVVMERTLGRPLTRGEIVHHKNGNTQDNRPDNLELMSRLEHNRTHGKGRLLRCEICGTEQWYGPANISRLRNKGADYRCRKCAISTRYNKICKRCGDRFSGTMPAQYCCNCTRKLKSRMRFWA